MQMSRRLPAGSRLGPNCARAAPSPSRPAGWPACRVNAAARPTAEAPQLKTLDEAVERLIAAAAAAEPETFAKAKRVAASKVEAELSHVKEVAAQLGVNRVDPALNAPARLNGMMSTDLRQITADSAMTVDRLTFNKLQPATLMVRNSDPEAQAAAGVPDMVKGPRTNVHPVEDGYTVFSCFRILQPGPDTPAGAFPPSRPDDLLGYTSVLGQFTLDPAQPARLAIAFTGLRVAPAAPGTQLQRWLEALRPHNPDMADDGSVVFSFPAPMPAHLDHIAMTPRWHITQGNLGSVVVMHTL